MLPVMTCHMLHTFIHLMQEHAAVLRSAFLHFVQEQLRLQLVSEEESHKKQLGESEKEREAVQVCVCVCVCVCVRVRVCTCVCVFKMHDI